jgi:hypothetical protein
MDAAAYVLRPFDADEEPLVVETVHRAVRALETWLVDGTDAAMNRQNGTAEEVAERQRQMASSPPTPDEHPDADSPSAE